MSINKLFRLSKLAAILKFCYSSCQITSREILEKSTKTSISSKYSVDTCSKLSC